MYTYIYICIYCVIHIARAYTKNARPQQDAELPEGAMGRERERDCIYSCNVKYTFKICWVCSTCRLSDTPNTQTDRSSRCSVCRMFCRPFQSRIIPEAQKKPQKPRKDGRWDAIGSRSAFLFEWVKSSWNISQGLGCLMMYIDQLTIPSGKQMYGKSPVKGGLNRKIICESAIFIVFHCHLWLLEGNRLAKVDQILWELYQHKNAAKSLWRVQFWAANLTVWTRF